MNTLQINKILVEDLYSRRYFKKVVAIDQLPSIFRKIKNSAYVINSHKQNQDGEHWIAVFYDSDSNCEFFDSFAMGPEFYGLENFLNKTSNSCVTNKFALQSIFSNFCGFYCVLFVLVRSRIISFENFLEYFDVDCVKNDEIIKNMFEYF